MRKGRLVAPYYPLKHSLSRINSLKQQEKQHKIGLFMSSDIWGMDESEIGSKLSRQIKKHRTPIYGPVFHIKGGKAR